MAVYEAIGSGVSGAKYYTLKLTVNEDSYSIPNNTSSVSWVLDLISSNGYNFSSWSFPITASVDGEVYNQNISRTIGKNATLRIASGTKTISHNSDGTKTISVGATVRATGAYYLPGNIDISGSLTLTTIPRASGITATNANIGSSTTISIDRKSSSFTHTITYSFSGLTGTIATGVATKTTWTVPTSFYAKIPNSKTGTCTLTCNTYNGGSLVGTSTTTFTVTAISKPTLSVTVTPTDYSALTGSATKLIKYVSDVIIQATATPNNSATISKIETNGQLVVSGATGTKTFNKVETGTFNTIATDSRGYTSTIDEKTFDIVPYVPLTITAKAERLNETSSTVKATINGNYFNSTFGSQTNTLTLQWYWKLKSATDYTLGGTLTATKSGNTYSYQGNLSGTFDYNKDYDFKFVAKDKINTTGIEAVSPPVLKGEPIYDAGVDRNGDNYFWANGNIYTTGSVFSNKMNLSQNNSLSTSITANSWQNVKSSGYSVTLPKGKYLLILGVDLSGSSNGIVTLRPTIDGSEIRTAVRSTIPVNSSLTSSAQVVCIIEQSTESARTINGQVYSNVSCTINSEDIRIIELSREV